MKFRPKMPEVMMNEDHISLMRSNVYMSFSVKYIKMKILLLDSSMCLLFSYAGFLISISLAEIGKTPLSMVF